MPNDQYLQNPALRPTILIGDLPKTVYLPTMVRELPQTRPIATSQLVARETPRAA